MSSNSKGKRSKADLLLNLLTSKACIKRGVILDLKQPPLHNLGGKLKAEIPDTGSSRGRSGEACLVLHCARSTNLLQRNLRKI